MNGSIQPNTVKELPNPLVNDGMVQEEEEGVEEEEEEVKEEEEEQEEGKGEEQEEQICRNKK